MSSVQGSRFDKLALRPESSDRMSEAMSPRLMHSDASSKVMFNAGRLGQYSAISYMGNTKPRFFVHLKLDCDESDLINGSSLIRYWVRVGARVRMCSS